MVHREGECQSSDRNADVIGNAFLQAEFARRIAEGLENPGTADRRGGDQKEEARDRAACTLRNSVADISPQRQMRGDDKAKNYGGSKKQQEPAEIFVEQPLIGSP